MTLTPFASRAAATCLMILLFVVTAVADDEEKIDFNKARELLRKQRAGQTLTDEEKSYLDRARTARRAGAQPAADRSQAVGEPKTSLGLTPLTDFDAGQTYKQQTGGLYGEGRNAPPEAHLQAALAAAGQIVPLDAEGKPSDDGKIVLISNGMSNTTQEFSAFVQLARRDRSINPRLVIVDCAQGGREASDWARPEERHRQGRPSPWEVQAQRLERAGVTPQQVQVVWMLQARRNPASLGEFPKHAQQLQQDQADVLRKLKAEFPNLKLAYLSSRIYAGYASTPLNPEPYAYESAWANQWLIRDQIAGEESLNYDSARGEVVAPVVLWGPYLWADGVMGRKSDELTYTREDLARDGTHPSESGRKKVAEQLLQFFKADETARGWFLGE